MQKTVIYKGRDSPPAVISAIRFRDKSASRGTHGVLPPGRAGAAPERGPLGSRAQRGRASPGAACVASGAALSAGLMAARPVPLPREDARVSAALRGWEGSPDAEVKTTFLPRQAPPRPPPPSRASATHAGQRGSSIRAFPGRRAGLAPRRGREPRGALTANGARVGARPPRHRRASLCLKGTLGLAVPHPFPASIDPLPGARGRNSRSREVRP